MIGFTKISIKIIYDIFIRKIIQYLGINILMVNPNRTIGRIYRYIVTTDYLLRAFYLYGYTLSTQ